MNLKLKNLVKPVLVLCFAFLLTHCTNDESIDAKPLVAQDEKIKDAEKITDAQKWFNSYKSKSNTGKLVDDNFNKAFRNIDYYWENATVIPLEDNATAVAVPIKDTPEDPDYKGQKMLYLYPSDSKYQSVIQEIFPDSDTDIDDNQKKEGFADINPFSGYIITWDLKRGFIKGARFKNDSITEVVKDVRMIFDTDASAKGKNTGKMAPMFDEGDAIGAERIVTTRGGGTAYPLNNVIVTQKSPAPTTPKNDYSIAGSFGGSSDLKGYINTPTGGGGSGITAPTSEQIIEKLTGKAKCLNDLLNKNGNSFVQKLLANFAGNSKFDISITSTDKVTVTTDGVIKEVNGKTIPPVGNLINIEISTSKADANSALDVVRTILHEYIHADIFRKLGTTLSTDKESLDFKTTYEAYGNQHSTIAILYLNSMKEALKEFHKTVLQDDYKKYTAHYGEVPSDAFYEALAWGGLRDANVKAWTDLPADKKASIEALANRVPMLSKTTPCTN